MSATIRHLRLRFGSPRLRRLRVERSGGVAGHGLRLTFEASVASSPHQVSETYAVDDKVGIFTREQKCGRLSARRPPEEDSGARSAHCDAALRHPGCDLSPRREI